MKALYLLRHGKSDWDAPYGGDHERPLAPRGQLAARQVGRWLTALGQQPGRVLTSSAARARGTVELAAEAGGWDCPIQVAPALYGASPGEILAEVQLLDDPCDRLLVAGHEPGWSAAVGALTGGSEVRMVTAALARIDLPARSWQEAGREAGILAWLITPKLLAAAGAASG